MAPVTAISRSSCGECRSKVVAVSICRHSQPVASAGGEAEVAGDVGERGVDHAGGLGGDGLLGLAERVQGLDAVAAHGAPIGTSV